MGKDREMKEPNRKRKGKLPMGVKILIGVLTVVILIAGTAFAYIQHKLNKINTADYANLETVFPQDEYFETDEDAAIDATALELEPEEIEWDIDENIMADKDVVNILLIGQDRREGETRARSDSMILLTINKKKETLQLTSLMRDLYVQIPGYSDNRINAAYAFGGMELLDQTIETNFSIQIDGNVEVDFSGFQSCIDKMNGIDMELTQAEAEYLNKKGNSWNLTSGINHLTGEQALAYARIRYVGNNDYERTERQRRVIMTIFEKMKSSGIGTILSLIDEIFPLLTTDISHSELLGYAVKVVSMGIDEIESYRIPIDGGYQAAVIRKMQVLVPDLEKNRNFLQEILYGE